MARKTFRDPLKRVKRRAIKTMLKSDSMYRMQNAAVRFVASEVLLAVIVGLASLVTARGADAHVYNYVVPCVISGVCTQFLREPLNNLCDDYTQPIAQKTQQLIANNWSNESFWMLAKHATGISLGVTVIALSAVNDTEYVVILVTQTLLTSFTVGLLKNPRHPLRLSARACVRRCRDRPRVRLYSTPTLHEDAMRRSDSDKDLLMTSLVTRQMVRTNSLALQGVQRIKQIRRRRRTNTSTRIVKVTSEQDFQEDVGELSTSEGEEQSESEEQSAKRSSAQSTERHEPGWSRDEANSAFDEVGIVVAGLSAAPGAVENGVRVSGAGGAGWDARREAEREEAEVGSEWRVM